MGSGCAGYAVLSACGRTINGGMLSGHSNCTMQFGNVPAESRQDGVSLPTAGRLPCKDFRHGQGVERPGARITKTRKNEMAKDRARAADVDTRLLFFRDFELSRFRGEKQSTQSPSSFLA
jgi:hypothetical protein